METAFSNSFIISWRSYVKYFLGWTKLDQNCVENQHSKWGYAIFEHIRA